MQMRIVLIGTFAMGLVVLAATVVANEDESTEALLGGGDPVAVEPAGEAPPLFTEPSSDVAGEAMDTAAPSDAMAGAEESPADGEAMRAEASPEASPLEATPELGPIGYDEQGQQGRIHIVVPGDTLWDISEAYLGTPWVWPSIWESNPDVANPHRIYPEDRIWITPTKMKRVSPEEAEALLARVPETEYEELPPAAVGDVMDAMPTTPMGRSFRYERMHAVGYVSAEDYEAAAAIVESPSLHTWLAQTRRVYIGLGEGEVSVGERLAVIRATEEVRDPATGRKIGVMVEPLGVVEVTRTDTETSEALIRVSDVEMRRGDRLVPYKTVNPEVTLRDASPTIEGQIAHFGSKRTVMADRDLVFLNRGSEHGVEVGNTFEVYRAGGSAHDVHRQRKVTLPDDVIADMVVIRADPTTSVAVVTRSNSEVTRGDYFRAGPH